MMNGWLYVFGLWVFLIVVFAVVWAIVRKLERYW